VNKFSEVLAIAAPHTTDEMPNKAPKNLGNPETADTN
jgi:hypothetical protein